MRVVVWRPGRPEPAVELPQLLGDDTILVMKQKLCAYVRSLQSVQNPYALYAWTAHAKGSEAHSDTCSRYIRRMYSGGATLLPRDLVEAMIGSVSAVQPSSRRKRHDDDDGLVDAQEAEALLRGLPSILEPLGVALPSLLYPVMPFQSTTTRLSDVQLESLRRSSGAESEHDRLLESYGAGLEELHVCEVKQLNASAMRIYCPLWHDGETFPLGIQSMPGYDALLGQVLTEARLAGSLDDVQGLSALQISCKLGLGRHWTASWALAERLAPGVGHAMPAVSIEANGREQVLLMSRHHAAADTVLRWVRKPGVRSATLACLFGLQEGSMQATLLLRPDAYTLTLMPVRPNAVLPLTALEELLGPANRALQGLSEATNHMVPLIDVGVLTRTRTGAHLPYVVTLSARAMVPDAANLSLPGVEAWVDVLAPMVQRAPAWTARRKDKQVTHLVYKRLDRFRFMDMAELYLARHGDATVQDLQDALGMSRREAAAAHEEWKRHTELHRRRNRGGSMAIVRLKVNPRSASYWLSVHGVRNLSQLGRLIAVVRYVAEQAKKPSSSSGKSTALLVQAEMASMSSSSNEVDAGNVDDEANDDEALDEEGAQLLQYVLAEEQPSASSKSKAAAGHVLHPQQGKKDEARADGDEGRYVINMLKSADLKLFDYASKRPGHKYISVCQHVDLRQPVVVSPQERAAYDAKKQDYGSAALAHGSTPELAAKNLYICPAVWCPRSRTPMSIEQFHAAGKRCPHPDEAAIVFRDKKYWMKPFPKDRHVGLTSQKYHPEGLALPCCFVKPQKQKHKSNTNNNAAAAAANAMAAMAGTYIKSSELAVEEGRYVALPPALHAVFNGQSHNIRCGPKPADGSGYVGSGDCRCFVRLGVSTGGRQPLLACMAWVLGFGTGADGVQQLLQRIKARLTVEAYAALDDGRVLRFFLPTSNNDDGLTRQREQAQHSLQGFLAYLHDPSIAKRHEPLMALLNTRLPWLNPSGLRLHVLSFDAATGEVAVTYQPHNWSASAPVAFVFHDRRMSTYEPIIQLAPGGRTTASFKKGFQGGVDAVLSSLSKLAEQLRNNKINRTHSNGGRTVLKLKAAVVSTSSVPCVVGLVLEDGGTYLPFDEPQEAASLSALSASVDTQVLFEDEVLQTLRPTNDAAATRAAASALNQALGRQVVTLAMPVGNKKNNSMHHLVNERTGAVVPVRGFVADQQQQHNTPPSSSSVTSTSENTDARQTYMTAVGKRQKALEALRRRCQEALASDAGLRAFVRTQHRSTDPFDTRFHRLKAKLGSKMMDKNATDPLLDRLLIELLTTPLSLQVALMTHPMKVAAADLVLVRDVARLPDAELAAKLAAA